MKDISCLKDKCIKKFKSYYLQYQLNSGVYVLEPLEAKVFSILLKPIFNHIIYFDFFKINKLSYEY